MFLTSELVLLATVEEEPCMLLKLNTGFAKRVRSDSIRFFICSYYFYKTRIYLANCKFLLTSMECVKARGRVLSAALLNLFCDA